MGPSPQSSQTEQYPEPWIPCLTHWKPDSGPTLSLGNYPEAGHGSLRGEDRKSVCKPHSYDTLGLPYSHSFMV